jgi:general stress protein 26
MHETPEDLERLQRLLDDSHAAGGRHLRDIFSDERRIPAAELPGLLPGVQVLNLATVTPKGEPRVAPVDGLFFRGDFWFGSAHDSARFKNIRRNPAVSAAHTRGEELAVIVHGTAHETPLEEGHPFLAYCVEVYGDAWFEFGEDAPYARIEPARMFTFRSR